MVFSSISFLCFFLPLLLAVYYIVPKRFGTIRNLVLLLFSMVFYLWGGTRYALLLLTSIGVNYLGGLAVGCLTGKGARRAALILAVSANLLLLGWFKYAGFISEIINALGISVPVLEIILPIGISFYTFQGMSYVIDVYRRDVPVQKNPIHVAFFVAFFPQLVAGPIVRYQTIAGEIVTRRESLSEFSRGLVRFLLGLGKKMILANTMGLIADEIFALDAHSAGLAWLGALTYTAQIYFDFSAYSDMAIGLGMLFGFHFPENFNYPYISASITEFWHRWHISLSTWFRDYVYIPLGGSRCSKSRAIRNTAIVWLLTGLWHGAAWAFILWGLWYLLLLLGERYLWNGLLERSPRFLRHICTMLLVTLGWVIFRAPNVAYAFGFMGRMFGIGASAETGQSIYYLAEYWPELVLAVIAALPVKLWTENWLKAGTAGWKHLVLEHGPKVLALVMLFLSYLKLATGSFNPFIYFQF